MKTFEDTIGFVPKPQTAFHVTHFFQPSILLYRTANLVMYGAFAVWFFPYGLLLGILVLLFSTLMTLPVLGMLSLFFWLARKTKINVVVSWTLLLFLVGLCAYLPWWLFGLYNDPFFDNGILQRMGLGSAYASVLFHGRLLHRYFLSIHTQKQPVYEND